MIYYNQDRDEKALVQIRPNVLVESFDEDGDISRFQNQTLRPIIKLQHNVLLDFLLGQPRIDSVIKYKQVRSTFEAKLNDFLNQPHLKGVLLGIIIGHFTTSEMKFYIKHSKDLSKRIKQMLVQRFIDSI
jgi:hypothetical protein